MRTIQINDLTLAGLDLLLDKESYLQELRGEELISTKGGTSPIIPATPTLTPEVVQVTIVTSPATPSVASFLGAAASAYFASQLIVNHHL